MRRNCLEDLLITEGRRGCPSIDRGSHKCADEKPPLGFVAQRLSRKRTKNLHSADLGLAGESHLQIWFMSPAAGLCFLAGQRFNGSFRPFQLPLSRTPSRLESSISLIPMATAWQSTKTNSGLPLLRGAG